jgi:hypothetical protein
MKSGWERVACLSPMAWKHAEGVSPVKNEKSARSADVCRKGHLAVIRTCWYLPGTAIDPA